MCKNICTVSKRKASHRNEPDCAFSAGWARRLNNCIGCSCVSFAYQLHPWCWDLLSIPFPLFGFVFAVSRQSLITTDKIYMTKRESFKKVKVRTQWHLQTMYMTRALKHVCELKYVERKRELREKKEHHHCTKSFGGSLVRADQRSE